MTGDTSSFLIAEAQLIIDEARRQKSERIKSLGSPIQLSGKALAIHVHENYVWIAENTAVARKLDLESGKTLQLYKGHDGPVTSVAFCDKVYGSGDSKILITGSWDQTIKLWDTDTRELLSSISGAHTDFVKSLFVLPSLELLISSGSDRIIRFWDLSTLSQKEPLKSVGSISSHTRPVECLDGEMLSINSAVLYTADTMGVIKRWTLTKEGGRSPRWQGTLQEELHYHRTRINEMVYGNNQLWTASSDDTVQVALYGTMTSHIKPIPHPVAVRSVLPLALTDLAEPYLITGAGDMLRVYDVTSLEEPELIHVIDAHWHDITAIRLWKRKTINDGRNEIEPWIVSTSLDGTIRKWRLSELLKPGSSIQANVSSETLTSKFHMSEEEERELAELLDLD